MLMLSNRSRFNVYQSRSFGVSLGVMGVILIFGILLIVLDVKIFK